MSKTGKGLHIAAISMAMTLMGVSCTLQAPAPVATATPQSSPPPAATIVVPNVPITSLPVALLTVTAFPSPAPTLIPPTTAPAATTTAPPTSPSATKPAATATAAHTHLPIYDTHVHYSQNAWADYSPENVLNKLRNADIRRALVSSTSDDGTLRLYKLDADRIVPMLRPYHDNVSSGNWTEQAVVPSYLENKLKTPIYFGIGEVHLNVGTADSAIARKAVQLAIDRNLYVHIHSDANTIRQVFAYAPKAKILWAHVGLSDPPEVASQMLDTYANLWVDTSIREYDIAPDGKLSDRWRALFMKHPDRITIGSDTWIPQRWADYENIMRFNRVWLAQLPREVAENIAYKNAVRLFGAGKVNFAP